MKRFRPAFILFFAAIVVLSGTALLHAAAYGGVASATRYLTSGTWRQAGWYLNWIKMLVSWLIFISWVVTADWVNRDLEETGLAWQRWNPIVFGCFMGTMVLTWLIPIFWLNVLLLLIAYIAPVTVYIVYRNKQVANHQKILTRDHLRYWASQNLRKLGIKVSAEASDPNSGGAPVTFVGRGAADPTADGGRVIAARQSTGLPLARQIVAGGLAARASAILMDFTPTTVAVRYMIDGLWTQQEPLEREAADPALQAFKLICGLNPQERRARQEGTFGVHYSVIRSALFEKMDRAEASYREKATIELTKRMASEELKPPQLQVEVAKAVEEQARLKFATPVGVWTPIDKEKLPTLPGLEPLTAVAALEEVKCPATVSCLGTQGGERAVIQFEIKAGRLATLDDLGMRTKLQEQLKELIARTRGLVLFAAMPGGGLRTTTKVVLLSLDRFIREFATIEDEENRYEEIENLPVTTYKGSAKQSPVDVLPKVFRELHHVIVVRDLVNAATVKMICDEIAGADHMFIGTARAKDAVEALVRIYAIEKAPIPEFADQVSGVLAQRLVRKLCDKCKEAYAPPQQVLDQLGIPKGRVRAFYRPPQPKPGDEDRKDICRECGGAGYKGQTAIFELLIVDDAQRKILKTTPKLDLLRQAARKAGMKSMKEEGILMVIRGTTSLPELKRVLEGGDGSK